MKLVSTLIIFLLISCNAQTKEESSSKCKDANKAIRNFKIHCVAAVELNESLGANQKGKSFPEKYCTCLTEKFAVESVVDETCDYYKVSINNQVFNQKSKDVCHY